MKKIVLVGILGFLFVVFCGGMAVEVRADEGFQIAPSDVPIAIGERYVDVSFFVDGGLPLNGARAHAIIVGESTRIFAENATFPGPGMSGYVADARFRFKLRNVKSYDISVAEGQYAHGDTIPKATRRIDGGSGNMAIVIDAPRPSGTAAPIIPADNDRRRKIIDQRLRR